LGGRVGSDSDRRKEIALYVGGKKRLFEGGRLGSREEDRQV